MPNLLVIFSAYFWIPPTTNAFIYGLLGPCFTFTTPALFTDTEIPAHTITLAHQLDTVYILLTMDSCVNCGLTTNRCNALGRHILDDAATLSVIQQWLSPEPVHSQDHLCQACWSLAQDVVLGRQPCTSRQFGHSSVCLRCRRSLIRQKNTHILSTASDSETRIYNVIREWILPLTVAGVVGRADVLACLFFLSSVLLYHGSSGKPSICSSIVLATLSMLAKETGLTALLFNMAFDLYRSFSPSSRSPTSKWRWKVGSAWSRLSRVLAALALLVGARLALLQGSLPAFSPQDNPPAFHPSFIVRMLTFCYLAAFNWWLLLCPWTLSHDWQMGSIPLVTSVWDLRNLMTCAAFGAMLLLVYRCITDLEVQRHMPAVAGILLLVLPYLPASNALVTVGFVVAERVLYIPSVGCVLLTSYGLQLVWRRGPRRALLLALGILLAAGVARTHLRNRDWRTRESLLRADLAVLPHNAKLHYNFANFLKDVDQQENAIKHYKEALDLWPSYASAHNNLGTLVVATGRAEHHFLLALKYNRDHVNAHYNLGQLYRKKDRIPEALQFLYRCISLEPRFVQAYLELLHIAPQTERQQLLDKLIQLEPTNWEHYVVYGNWLMDRGLYPLSLKYYTSAMRLSILYEPSRGNLASLRAICLLLRNRGQRARMLQFIARWQISAAGDGAGAWRRGLAERAWRLRAELAGRAALYARPHKQPASTCLHHSQLEVNTEVHKNVPNKELSRTYHSNSGAKHTTNGCQSKINLNNKKDVSISASYKPIHNKSETGHKQKSCPLHKKKKIKERETITPFVTDHLIKTY